MGHAKAPFVSIPALWLARQLRHLLQLRRRQFSQLLHLESHTLHILLSVRRLPVQRVHMHPRTSTSEVFYACPKLRTAAYI
jgi:hypothetical protein